MKKIVAIVLVIVMLFALTACEEPRKIEYAYIALPNGNVIEVEVDRCLIYVSSVTIKAKDGREYRVSMENCLLTTDRLDKAEK